MRSSAFLLLLLALVLTPATRADGEVRVDGSLDPGALAVGESAVLTISIEGAASVEGDPRVPAPEGVRVRDAGESRSFSLVNGKFTQSIQRQFMVVALRPGTYELGPVEVRVSGRVYRVGPYTLVASTDSGTPAPPQPGAPGARPRDRNDDDSQAGAGSRGAPPVAVEMRADPAEVYAGQQMILRITFLRRADVAVLNAHFVPPTTEGFWKEDLPPERQRTQVRGNISYAATDILMAAFPTRPGSLTISPASVEVQYRDPRDREPRDPFGFFGMGGRAREAAPASSPVSIRVLPLPPGAPAAFTGAVGRFTIDGDLDRREAVQGEPITWTFVIEGEGNVASVEGPPFPEIPGCRGYDAGSEAKTTKVQDRVGGQKRLSRVLVPEAAGRLDLPAVAWAYFDPEAVRYRELEIPARRINVAPSTAAGVDGSSARVGGAIRGIRKGGRLTSLASERPWRQPLFWVIQALPLAALVAGFVTKRRREEILRDPRGLRMRQAPRKLRASLQMVQSDPSDPWGSLSRALEDFVADQYGPEVRGLTRKGLAMHLVALGVAEEAAGRMAALLERADSLRFTPGSAAGRTELSQAVLDAADCAASLAGRSDA